MGLRSARSTWATFGIYVNVNIAHVCTRRASKGGAANRMPHAAWLARAAAAHPDRVALETDGGPVTYAELGARAERAARRLAARGVGAGDLVALALTPGPAFVETLHGCWLLGAVAMPVDARLADQERAAQTATAKLTVEQPLDGAEANVALLIMHRADAVATVVHTSGTTAAPKPVELTFGNWAASARGSAAGLGVAAGDRWLCALPLAHVGGLSIPIRSAIYGTTLVLHHGFETDRVAAALRGDGITLTSLVPTMLARLLDAGLERPPALRCAVMGGAPLSRELCERGAAAGLPLAQTYGLTESCSQVTLSAIGEPETAGRALPGSTIEISPDGEILVGGPVVAPASVAADGLLHTGDLGALDDEGRLTVTGRAVDTIVTGGENVAPAEVEAVLIGHPAVAEALVRSQPDPNWGEAVIATVVLTAGVDATEDELRDHCRSCLAGFKVPKAIDFAAELPRTPSGKLRRRARA